jgi:hypothetical protein
VCMGIVVLASDKDFSWHPSFVRYFVNIHVIVKLSYVTKDVGHLTKKTHSYYQNILLKGSGDGNNMHFYF